MAGKAVFPGDDVFSVLSVDKGELGDKVVLGPGIRRDGELLKVTKCGVLNVKARPTIVWVDSHQKRYVAVKGERVIGTVLQKGSYTLKVDIGTSEPAVLSLLAFEGATKRNKPTVQVGDLVFARVLSASKDIESELVCVTSHGKKEGMGVLPVDGFMINVPINVVRRILSPGCRLLKCLGSKFKYEIACGLNGRVWVRSINFSTTVFICNTVAQVEHLSEDELNILVDEVMNEFEVYSKP